MAQGTWRIQTCNESMEKGTAAVELSSHATILKMGGVKAGQNTVSNSPLAKLLLQCGSFACTTTGVSISATLVVSDRWTRSDPVSCDHLKQSQSLFANRVVLVYERREKLL